MVLIILIFNHNYNFYHIRVCRIYSTQGEARAAHVEKKCELPEDGQQLSSKHVGAIIDR